jgi:hypothetical protein
VDQGSRRLRSLCLCPYRRSPDSFANKTNDSNNKYIKKTTRLAVPHDDYADSDPPYETISFHTFVATYFSFTVPEPALDTRPGMFVFFNLASLIDELARGGLHFGVISIKSCGSRDPMHREVGAGAGAGAD